MALSAPAHRGGELLALLLLTTAFYGTRKKPIRLSTMA